MSSPDLGQLMARAREVQERLASLQRQLAERRVEGAAGGGMVKAVATGALRVVEIRIEPELFESGDRAMLEDLVTAAVNAALGNAQKLVQEEIQRASAGMTLPDPSGSGPGPGGP